MRFVILGGSGSGKSTQAQNLSRHFNVPTISTGEILRQATSSLGELADNARYAIATGELVSDELMINLIRNHLQQPNFTKGWVLEGYPRTAFQAEELDFLLDELGQKLNYAIYLQTSQAVMVSRSKARSQPDDQPEIVQRRVELFYDRTVPILEYYDSRHRLLTIDGNHSPAAVEHNIITLLSNTEAPI